MLEVRLTANFEKNLGDIEHYLLTADAESAYLQLLDMLTDKVVPNLSLFPEIVRKYLGRHQQSLEAIALLTQIEKLCPPDELREYLLNDYLVLYINISNIIYLLAIRHHRQLAFQYTQK